MATVTLTLYTSCRILKGKNFVVDDIEDYLATLSATTVSGLQYQRFDLKKTINLELDQVWQTKQSGLPYDSSTVATKWNYCKITTVVNATNINYYYFITGYKQLSPKTMELSIEMDTLNTFKYYYITSNSTYTLSPKTVVKREHKDRFKVLPARYQIVPITAEETYAIGQIDSWLDYQNTSSHKTVLTINTTGIADFMDDNSLSTLSVYYMVSNGAYIQYNNEKFYNVVKIVFSSSAITLYNSNNVSIKTISWAPGLGNTHIDNFVVTVPTSGAISQGFVTGSYDWTAYTYQAYYTTYTIQILDSGTYYQKVVDKYDEQINPILFKTSERYLFDDDQENTWYVIYSSENAVTSDADSTEAKYINPVKVQFASDVGYSLTTSSPSRKTFDAQDSQIPDAKNTREYLKIKYSDFENDNAYIEVGGTRYYRTGLSGQNVYYIERKNNTDVVFSRFLRGIIGSTTTLVTNFGTITAYGINSCQIQTCLDISNPFNIAVEAGTFYFGSGTGTITASGGNWSTLNLSNPKLIKAINFPYSPIDFLVDNQEMTSYPDDLDWNSSQNLLQLTTPQENFFRKINFDKNPFKELILIKPTVVYSQAKNIQNEPKLLNSSFSHQKFVYDSYSFPFRFEYFNAPKYYQNWGPSEGNFIVNYVCSNNIISKFYFEFPQYICNYETQDYNNLLIVDRNNEKALFNNAFINYMKTGGYGHDTNKANTQNAINGITTALSLAGAIASFATAGYTGGAGIAAGIGLTATAFAGITRSINAAHEQDAAISQKVNQAALQGTSVIGGNDVSLFKMYGKNKSKMVFYEVSETMKKALWDLFYYCGYATHEQKVPSISTRLYFNFVQAEIEYKTYTFNDDVAEDIKKKWAEGITFFHKVNASWDFDQQYENWETSLL